MHQYTINGKTVSVFPSKTDGAPVIYLNTFGEEGQQVFAALQKLGPPPFSLVAVSHLDWNHDMVPWDAPSAFKNGPLCTDGADDYLQLLTRAILPAAEESLPGVPCWRGLAGYSLAGLFALYAPHKTDRFSRIASMSGSLWFPGLQEYLVSHTFQRSPDCLYFSLGDKESKTRNPVLRTIQDNTQAVYDFFQSQGIRSTFVLHPGNHYSHTAERTAAGIAWLLTQ